MTKPVLILGGGPAGLAAAHSLAAVGKKCVIVEKEDKLGGAPILSGYAKLVPTGEWAKDAIGGMVTRVEEAPEVTVMTGTTVTGFDGSPGDFQARLSNGDNLAVDAAVLVVASPTSTRSTSPSGVSVPSRTSSRRRRSSR